MLLTLLLASSESSKTQNQTKGHTVKTLMSLLLTIVLIPIVIIKEVWNVIMPDEIDPKEAVRQTRALIEETKEVMKDSMTVEPETTEPPAQDKPKSTEV